MSIFLLNDIWTFHDKRNGGFLRRMLKFNFARVLAVAVNLVVLWGLVSLGLHYLAANFIGIAVATVFTYSSSLWWVWK